MFKLLRYLKRVNEKTDDKFMVFSVIIVYSAVALWTVNNDILLLPFKHLTLVGFFNHAIIFLLNITLMALGSMLIFVFGYIVILTVEWIFKDFIKALKEAANEEYNYTYESKSKIKFN